jgi:PKD repeat protein
MAGCWVQFTDTSTGVVDSYDWDFGDASPHSAGADPLHYYEAEDDYTVSLTVTNVGGSNTHTEPVHAFNHIDGEFSYTVVIPD